MPESMDLETPSKAAYAAPMNYASTLDHIFGLARIGEKFDLEGPRALAAALGHPERKSRAVLIGGTNGKGSTSAFLEAILRDAGLKTGLFTSPHLISYRERIRIDGENISEEAVCRLYAQVESTAKAHNLHPTFFESTFALACLAFAEANVDVAIWEAGLGGRLDTTNICTPEVSAVVSLGLEHTEILGPTLDHIAREKAGLFRENTPNLTTATDEALEALLRQSPYKVTPVDVLPGIASLSLPLAGDYQKRNASLAWRLAETLGIHPRIEALQKVSWPGRVERIGNVIIDCAHNPHGASALASYLKAASIHPLHMIYGAMRGKDVQSVASILMLYADSVTLVTPKYPRRHTAAELAPVFSPHPCVSIEDDVGKALDTRPDHVTLVAGSCFLAGEARAHLLHIPFPECGIVTTVR